MNEVRPAQVDRMVQAVLECRHANFRHNFACTPENDAAVRRAQALVEACARNCTLDELSVADRQLPAH